MAGTVIPRTQLSHVPLTDPAGTSMDSTNGNLIQNSGATIWRINNGAVSTSTVTFTPVTSVEDFTITHAAYSVVASAIVWVGKHDVPNFGANLFAKASQAGVLLTAFEG
jgi:hypothetical protein